VTRRTSWIDINTKSFNPVPP